MFPKKHLDILSLKELQESSKTLSSYNQQLVALRDQVQNKLETIQKLKANASKNIDAFVTDVSSGKIALDTNVPSLPVPPKLFTQCEDAFMSLPDFLTKPV
ncbi:hypothetical protein RCL1_004851 [Eukaryota sp. TZLM3-RCL]